MFCGGSDLATFHASIISVYVPYIKGNVNLHPPLFIHTTNFFFKILSYHIIFFLDTIPIHRVELYFFLILKQSILNSYNSI